MKEATQNSENMYLDRFFQAGLYKDSLSIQ
jgi:hypothetical protein